MVETIDRRVALISVHPEYAEKILNGEKQVELRRSKLHSAVSHLVIYATAPKSAVLGWVRVTGIDTGSPTRLWNRHKQHAGVSRRQFRRYFKGSRAAFAIHVDQPQSLHTPLHLNEINRDLCPPQSWRYLSNDEAARVGIEL
jgi:predicted transcriptional regulator